MFELFEPIIEAVNAVRKVYQDDASEPMGAFGGCFDMSEAICCAPAMADVETHLVKLKNYLGSLENAVFTWKEEVPGDRKTMGHFVYRIDDRYIDFTARQFDFGAAFPEVSTKAELRERWKQIIEVPWVPSLEVPRMKER